MTGNRLAAIMLGLPWSPAFTHQPHCRELQVASAVAAGASNREVAETLFVSEKTVEFHLGKSFQKLGIRSRVELARMLILDERID